MAKHGSAAVGCLSVRRANKIGSQGREEEKLSDRKVHFYLKKAQLQAFSLTCNTLFALLLPFRYLTATSPPSLSEFGNNLGFSICIRPTTGDDVKE